MKRLVALLLTLSLVFAFASCTKYKPVKSTAEEERVMMTLTVDGEEYEVRYELYRALFLNHKSEVDGGDATVWSGESSKEYIDKINALIIEDAAEIFSTIHLSEKLADYDVYSSKADKRVETLVEESVEGGESGKGFGTYEAYLAFLKEQNLNYSVQDLLYRYYIATEELEKFFLGDTESDSITSDEILTSSAPASFNKVRAFYYSDSFTRIIYAYFSELVTENPGFSINDFRREMVSAANEGRDAVETLINGRTAAQGAGVGIFLSKNATADDTMRDIKEVSFALEVGAVSEVITLSGTNDPTLDGFYILYKLQKSEADFREYYSEVRSAYLLDLIGVRISECSAALRTSVSYSSGYSALIHANISM